MWKDTDFYSKRDDDSAIGDSENNSAEEESMNSRRKSSISDDIDEMTIDPHVQFLSKLDQKIPECLLKSSDELIENCRKIQKTYGSTKTKPKREIRVLPSAAAVIPRKVSTGAVKTSTRENTSLLDAKFQYLLSEMKKLRELDQDILKKFLELSESVEEVRWKLTENEEVLKRKMAEEAEEELTFTCEQTAFDANDVTEPVNNYVNVEVSKFSNNDVTHSPNSYENLDLSKTTKNNIPTYEKVDVIKSTANVSPALSLRSSSNMHVPANTTVPNRKPKVTPHTSPTASVTKHEKSSILTNPTYAPIEIRDHSIHTPERKRTSKQNSTTPNKDARNRETPSDVWVVRDDFGTTRTERPSRRIGSRNSIAVAPIGLGNNHSPPNPGLGLARRRKSDVTQPHFRGRSNLGACSFRMVADENSRIGRLAQWTVAEEKADLQSTNTQSQSSYPHHAVGLSRLRGTGSLFQTGITKPSESSSSLNSSSSRTSSESSNSVPPAPLKRSNSSKWGKFFRRTSKSESSGLGKKPNGIAINNNYKPAPSLGTKSITDPILSEVNVVPVSYKRTADNATRWTHHNDDITYL